MPRNAAIPNSFKTSRPSALRPSRRASDLDSTWSSFRCPHSFFDVVNEESAGFWIDMSLVSARTRSECSRCFVMYPGP